MEPDKFNKKPPMRARCICLGGHYRGLARSTRKTKGQYMTEPGAPSPLHFTDCPHSELKRCTPKTLIPEKRRRRPVQRFVI